MVMLTHASDQLFSRPDDEHYPDLKTLGHAAERDRRNGEEVVVDPNELFVVNGDKVFVDSDNDPIELTNYSMGQLARFARVPMELLGRMTPDLRTKVLNEVFDRERDDLVALVDGDRLRCLTSEKYTRLWDHELVQAVNRWLIPAGWIPAMPTLNTDSKGTNVQGNTKPCLFRSDRDSFMFFYGPPADGGDEFGGLRKGIVTWNSEVGHKSYGYETFLFRDMCANFLIWDASQVVMHTARHVGNVRRVFNEFQKDIRKVSVTMTTADLDRIEIARATPFVAKGKGSRGDARAAAALRLNKEFDMTLKGADAAVKAMHDPRNEGTEWMSHWAISNGITLMAQERQHADARVLLGRTAGSVMDAAYAE